MKDYKQYTVRAQSGIKGEAFFKSIISNYSIPHHITGPEDLGFDYICEWVHDEKPSGVLFGVQVKTLSGKYVKPSFLRINEGLNKLSEFDIKDSKLDIHDRTLNYWRGFGIPVYLFVVIYSDSSDQVQELDCYYKRFTRVLTKVASQDEECFYKVNEGTAFLAFADKESKKYGFARDLFIDLIRCSYYKGSISYISPGILGLKQFSEDVAVFSDLFDEYSENIDKTIEQTKILIDLYEKDQGTPTEAPPDDE